MKKLFSNLKEKNAFIFFIILLIFFVIAFNPTHTFDKQVFKGDDKIKHILAFFTLSYFFIHSSIKLHTALKVFILILIAFFIEYIQHFIHGRESSFSDFSFSILGVVLYFLFIFIFQKFSR